MDGGMYNLPVCFTPLACTANSSGLIAPVLCLPHPPMSKLRNVFTRGCDDASSDAFIVSQDQAS